MEKVYVVAQFAGDPEAVFKTRAAAADYIISEAKTNYPNEWKAEIDEYDNEDDLREDVINDLPFSYLDYYIYELDVQD